MLKMPASRTIFLLTDGTEFYKVFGLVLFCSCDPSLGWL